jgi:hypothetical protein
MSRSRERVEDMSHQVDFSSVDEEVIEDLKSRSTCKVYLCENREDFIRDHVVQDRSMLTMQSKYDPRELFVISKDDRYPPRYLFDEFVHILRKCKHLDISDEQEDLLAELITQYLKHPSKVQITKTEGGDRLSNDTKSTPTCRCSCRAGEMRQKPWRN